MSPLLRAATRKPPVARWVDWSLALGLGIILGTLGAFMVR